MIEQILIFVFGVTAIYLSQQSNERLKKYACVFGLISQPFWFYSSWVTGQWGIFILSVCYAVAWGVGFVNHWIVGATHGTK